MDQGTLPKAYEPAEIEKRWYSFWEEKKLFHADDKKTGKEYSIVIPPPNVTGSLHMGHALNNTMQDILVRYYRMNGYNTLWMPGTDHAGIATQNVVEKQLAQEGLKREDLGREKFIETSLDLESPFRRSDYQSAQKTRLLLRLGSGKIHHGRRTFPGSARGVRATLRRRTYLQRGLHC